MNVDIFPEKKNIESKKAFATMINDELCAKIIKFVIFTPSLHPHINLQLK